VHAHICQVSLPSTSECCVVCALLEGLHFWVAEEQMVPLLKPQVLGTQLGTGALWLMVTVDAAVEAVTWF